MQNAAINQMKMQCNKKHFKNKEVILLIFEFIFPTAKHIARNTTINSIIISGVYDYERFIVVF